LNAGHGEDVSRMESRASNDVPAQADGLGG
jgi:hypothetical protein